MDLITVHVDGVEAQVKPGQTLLAAADEAGVYIPRLCAHPDLPPAGDCRLCLVEVEGGDGPATACNLPVADGMVVHTDTPALRQARQRALAQILAHHPHACLTCAHREGCDRITCSMGVPVEERCCALLGRCELERVADYVGIPPDTPRYTYANLPVVRDEPAFDRDMNLCIGCLRCVVACREVGQRRALEPVEMAGLRLIQPTQGTLKASNCRFCGACVEVCPTGALLEHGPKGALWRERTRAKLGLRPVPLPPAERWLPFEPAQVAQVPEVEGVYQLFDDAREVIRIAGTIHLRRALEQELRENSRARFFVYEVEPMYTRRESELIQQYVQEHGRLPGAEDELDELF